MLEKMIVFVEEPSMEVTLEHLLPKLMADTNFEIRRFQGKDDFLQKLPDHLRGCRTLLCGSWALLVLIDRDDDECLELKRSMENMVSAAGLISKNNAGNGKRFWETGQRRPAASKEKSLN